MIGDRIKMRRLELGLTQEELAKRMGYKSKSTINKVEAGINDVNMSTTKRYAKALETTVAYLMGWVDISDKIIATSPSGKALSANNMNNTDMGKEIIDSQILSEMQNYLNGTLPTFEELDYINAIRRLSAYDKAMVVMMLNRDNNQQADQKGKVNE